MKTRSLYLVAFLLMSAVATFGKDEPKTSGLAVLPMKGTEVFKVIYAHENANKVKVVLYNASSQIVFSESINSTTGFILPLNFSKLAFGDYKLELTDATGTRTESIKYQPAISNDDNIRIARLTNEHGKFLVAIANPKNEKVTVKIFDNYNNLLHTEVRNVSGDFAQVYNVKNLTGACTFQVSDNKGTVKTVQF